MFSSETNSSYFQIYIQKSTSQLGASDSVAYFSALLNSADAQNVSCLGLCGRDIWLKAINHYIMKKGL